jgi:small-conductance mechanosensitive channel
MLSRTGIFILGALTLAATPLLASAAVGTSVVFARRLRPGDYAEIGGQTGRVARVGLLEVHLSAAGVETRVPHLLSLLHPTRVFGDKRNVRVDITIDARTPLQAVVQVLIEAAKGCAEEPKVEIVSINPSAVHYRVEARSAADEGNSDLALAVHQALQQAGLTASETERR